MIDVKIILAVVFIVFIVLLAIGAYFMSWNLSRLKQFFGANRSKGDR